MHLRTKKGFSLIEVALVLAITGLVFVGIVSGISNNVSRQRYNDSVQDFAEFLRRVYSEATNIENPPAGDTINNKYCTAANVENGAAVFNNKNTSAETIGGRSECAFYGKLISFGENDNGDDDDNLIYVYDIIGEVYNTNSNIEDTSITGYLYGLKSDILAIIPSPDNNRYCTFQPFSTMYSYRPTWNTKIETTSVDTPFKGQILIARSPTDNSVQTLYHANSVIYGHTVSEYGRCNKTTYSRKAVQEGSIYNHLNGTSYFTSKGYIDFCVASGDILQAGGRRRNVRINVGDADATNASNTVRVINTDDADDDKVVDKCKV